MQDHLKAHFHAVHGFFVTCFVLLALAGTFLGILIYQVALRSRADLMTLAILGSAWLNLVFPFTAVCVLFHHFTPGAEWRRACFPVWLEALFWVNAIGWFGVAFRVCNYEFRPLAKSLWWIGWLLN